MDIELLKEKHSEVIIFDELLSKYDNWYYSDVSYEQIAYWYDWDYSRFVKWRQIYKPSEEFMRALRNEEAQR